MWEGRIWYNAGTAEGRMTLRWEDAEDIAEQLLQAHPETDPLSVRFTDLHRWVTELPGFADDPQASSEGKLEAIQMAWLELYKEQND
jgi:FeS assembly protein IscX